MERQKRKKIEGGRRREREKMGEIEGGRRRDREDGR